MDPLEIDARINTLVAQREASNNQVVMMAGMMAVKDARIKALEAELNTLKGAVEGAN